MRIIFTGIVEEIGEVKNIARGSESISLTIKAKKVLSDVKLGDSIATNGVCLTVTDFKKGEFTVDVMPETMRKSSLKEVKIGSEVNLERALKANDRLGGHIVSGHIDGVGKITKKRREDNAIILTIKPPPELLKYIVNKGSITIDGISLTIAEVKRQGFSISLIPHTSEVTILSDKTVGDLVNLEVDVIGKYVENLLQHGVDYKQNNNENANRKESTLASKLGDYGFID